MRKIIAAGIIALCRLARVLGLSNMRTVIIFIAFMSLSLTAHADEIWDFSIPHQNRCLEGGQQEMNACLATEYKKVDARLNNIYNRLRDVMADDRKLKEAQSAWIHFRDLTCDFENFGMEKDGSQYPFALNACRINITEKRIRDLTQYLERDCEDCPLRKQHAKVQ